jgi:threonine dehydrogenase-like Zn-dependent dehydrogenase
METALNVVWDADVEPGDRVAVIGAGVVGLLISHLVVRYPGIELRLFDVDPAKAPVARALGLPFALAPDRDETFDVLIHASGDPRGLALALSHADFEALIVEASWFGDSVVALPLGEAFHSRRLTIRSSQVGAVATRQRARWSHRRRLELALRLLGDDRLDHLITGESPFAKLPQVMTRLASGDLPALCHRIVYS